MATYYVRADASGGNDGSQATADKAWTWAELLTAWTSTLNAGDIVYIVAVGGTISRTTADTPTRDGGSPSPITIAGCYEQAGDLDIPSYNADGTLVVTRYPVISFTGTGRLNASGADGTIYRNLYIKANVSADTVLMGGNCCMLSCRLENANTGSSAQCLSLGTIGDVIDTDAVMTGGSGGYTCINTSGGDVTGCRVLGGYTRGIYVGGSGASVTGCTIVGNGSGVGIDWASGTSTHEGPSIKRNTIVNWTTGIQSAAVAYSRLMQVVNNSITGCTTGVLSLYDGTAQVPILCVANRLRNTTNLNGFDNWYAATGGDASNVVTAGSDATDYVDAANGDYRIKPGSPGSTAGIGGVPAGAAARAGSGGVLVRPGRAGRF